MVSLVPQLLYFQERRPLRALNRRLGGLHTSLDVSDGTQTFFCYRQSNPYPFVPLAKLWRRWVWTVPSFIMWRRVVWYNLPVFRRRLLPPWSEQKRTFFPKRPVNLKVIHPRCDCPNIYIWDYRGWDHNSTRRIDYSEQFFVKLRSDDGLLDGPKLVTLKLMYMLCNTVFSNTVVGKCLAGDTASHTKWTVV